MTHTERLAKSIKKGEKSREKDFFSSFGAFTSDKSAEEIAKEIRESRKFYSLDEAKAETKKRFTELCKKDNLL